MDRFPLDADVEQFETCLVALGLDFKRIELKTRPSAIHWHIRKPGFPGTLEATYDQGEMHLETRRNRMGAWVQEVIEQLTKMGDPF